MVAGGLAVVVAAGGAGCSSTRRTIQPSSAAHQIATQLAARYHLSPPAVSCPPGVPAEKGRRFTCTTTLDGQTIKLDATVTGGSGGFTVQPETPILVPTSVATQLAGELTRRAGHRATVVCPGPQVEVVPVGHTLACSATFAGQPPRPVTVTVVDRQGNFGFQLAPAS